MILGPKRNFSYINLSIGIGKQKIEKQNKAVKFYGKFDNSAFTYSTSLGMLEFSIWYERGELK